MFTSAGLDIKEGSSRYNTLRKQWYIPVLYLTSWWIYVVYYLVFSVSSEWLGLQQTSILDANTSYQFTSCGSVATTNKTVLDEMLNAQHTMAGGPMPSSPCYLISMNSSQLLIIHKGEQPHAIIVHVTASHSNATLPLIRKNIRFWCGNQGIILASTVYIDWVNTSWPRVTYDIKMSGFNQSCLIVRLALAKFT